MSDHGVSRRWFTKTDVKHFTSGALRAITNITKRIPSQVLFKDFADRFGMTYLKKWISLKLFFENFVGRFRIATNLKTGLPKKYS